MSCPRFTHFLFVLLLAVTLFGAATGVVDAHRSHGESPVAAELPVFVDLQASIPEREDSAPRANKIGKHRLRESSLAPAARVDAALTHILDASHWAGLANSSIVDSVSRQSNAACSSHACTHASPRLQLKLQLGQAP